MANERMKTSNPNYVSRREYIAKAAAAMLIVEGLSICAAQGCGDAFTSSGIDRPGGSAGSGAVAGSGGSAGSISSGGSSGHGGLGGGTAGGGYGGTTSTGGQAGEGGLAGAGGSAGATSTGGSAGAGGSGPVACVQATTGNFSGFITTSTPQSVGGYVFEYLGMNPGNDALFDITCGGMARYASEAFPESVTTTLEVTVDSKRILVTPNPIYATQAYVTIDVQAQ